MAIVYLGNAARGNRPRAHHARCVCDEHHRILGGLAIPCHLVDGVLFGMDYFWSGDQLAVNSVFTNVIEVRWCAVLSDGQDTIILDHHGTNLKFLCG